MYQGDVSTVLQVSIEPGVIDRDMLVALAIEQGPKDEAGKHFVEDGIKLHEMSEIRIEFLHILKIDYMWAMPNLVTLKLCNNIIEKIENLEILIHLRELDLSFNRIRIMENLNYLTNLEVLLLYCNEITKVEGIENLEVLSILSIGNNKVADWDHVTYLRKFSKLRSLNMEKNPCTEQEEYVSYLIAYIPQLVYYQYRMIGVEERNAAMEKYCREISYLVEREMKEKEETEAARKLQENVDLLSVSYVEYLDGDTFFHRLFEHDREGQDLSAINEDTQSAFEEYRKMLSSICRDLYDMGLREHESRMAEIESFNGAVNETKEAIQRDAREIADKLVERKESMVAELKDLIKDINEDIEIDSYRGKIEKARHLVEEFNELISKTWSDLMLTEVTLHDQIEDINEVFKTNMTEMVNTFLEATQDYFALMRNAEAEYNDAINAAVLYYISGFGDDAKLPQHLTDLCGDKDILANNLAASHDTHLQAIDARESSMLVGLRNWLETYVVEQVKRETQRNRQQILEISHFLDRQKEEFDTLDIPIELRLSGLDDPGEVGDDGRRN